MTGDFDPRTFYEEFGIDVRLSEPTPEPGLSPFAGRLRDELLDHVTRARASLEIIEGLLRQDPNNDGAFDAVDATFSASLDASRAAFERFRGHRECAGEA